MSKKSFDFTILFLILITFLNNFCTSEGKKEISGKINNSSIIMEGVLKKDTKETPEEVNNSLITLEGIVKEAIVSAKTLSEYRYYYIYTNNMEKIILFNNKLFSAGLNSYIGKRVEVKGVTTTGFIGWRKTQREGIKIQEIREIK
jgi:hypothetical protein